MKYLKKETGFPSETFVWATRQNNVHMGVITSEIMIRYILLIYIYICHYSLMINQIALIWKVFWCVLIPHYLKFYLHKAGYVSYCLYIIMNKIAYNETETAWNSPVLISPNHSFIIYKIHGSFVSLNEAKVSGMLVRLRAAILRWVGLCTHMDLPLKYCSPCIFWF